MSQVSFARQQPRVHEADLFYQKGDEKRGPAAYQVGVRFFLFLVACACFSFLDADFIFVHLSQNDLQVVHIRLFILDISRNKSQLGLF